jgi:hypothetical protein
MCQTAVAYSCRASIQKRGTEDKRLDQMGLWELKAALRRLTVSTALSGSCYLNPPALPEVDEFSCLIARPISSI